MASMNRIVIDISSDEEDDKLVDYSDWFDGILTVLVKKRKVSRNQKSDLAVAVKDDNGDDDCVILDHGGGDDCVILDRDGAGEDDDDDCVILYYVPYNTTAKKTEVYSSDSDEVLVLGQKGEIACRDFPHPRHACAVFPFKSTSHQNYCKMCHCYVCDIPAPCPHWCVSISAIDHCHANDQDQTWKNQRQSIRSGKPSLTTAKRQRIEVRPCSTSTRPGSRTKKSRSFLQNPGLLPASYFRLNKCSDKVQTSEALSETVKSPANQRSGISNDKVLSEFEDSSLTGPVCPGQGNDPTFKFDFETFIE